ncbi:MAG: hypothetical protein H7099_18595 [Gemmatimonadaceae bacterium]|nr:hypothetical protein [Gemmatimonadaceae bacterium]
MPLSQLSRRELIAAVLALSLDPGRLVHACDEHRARNGPHPTPRPGIDASKVLPSERLKDTPRVQTAFDEVRRIPAIVDGIRCHCGCADADGFYSLLSCFEGDGMARHCDICRGQGRLAFRLHKTGKTLDQIRAAIDDRYG